MKTFESNWKTRDGLDIFARGWEPDRGPKAVVGLVHGLGEHIARYNHVAQALADAGYAVLGFDLRGHGRSAGARGHAPSFESYMQDLDVLIEQARSRYPLLPIFLYGHSLGGILVLNYGLRRRPDLRGAIVTAAALHSELEQQPVKVLLARILGALLPNVSIATGLIPGRISHDKSVVDAYINDPLVHDRITLGCGRMMIEVNHWALDHAGEFPLPLLLMHGKDDLLAFPSSSLEFAAPLKEKCTLILWEAMYHEIHNESGKDKVFKTMVDWLDAHLKG